MIDLFSDTATKPGVGMREAIRKAEVGDEQKGEDPTVNRLLDMVAELTGKEAALFLPSGTMCNLVAIKTLTQPGETILVEQLGHILRMESGGAALASGVIVETIDSAHGQFSGQDVLQAMPANMVYTPPATVLCVEQTHNFRGGTTWTVAELEAVAEVAHENGLAVHMDGARLMNAVVASGESAQRFAAPCDSVWIDFTKGLGAPMGAVLAGSRDFIERARRYKHVFGGALRQAGIVAAGCIYALEHNVERLQEDHEHAQLLAEGLSEIDGVRVTNRVDTNILYFDTTGAEMEAAVFQSAMQARGVSFSHVNDLMRAVTHLGVSREDIEQAVETAKLVLNGRSSRS
ncbi:MAG: aminotransferase class I/II-fold pyridoxal phosphate-dependent enzyme [Chloroflexi bacterium]|jgi:threonine aldolase|nr:aminotransferase class I/II-fold pyridoxal phosphate-dependent enzyme [Chloroflexota bacterium]